MRLVYNSQIWFGSANERQFADKQGFADATGPVEARAGCAHSGELVAKVYVDGGEPIGEFDGAFAFAVEDTRDGDIRIIIVLSKRSIQE